MLVDMNKYKHTKSQSVRSPPTVELLTVLGVDNVTVCEQIDIRLVSHQQDKLNLDLKHLQPHQGVPRQHHLHSVDIPSVVMQDLLHYNILLKQQSIINLTMLLIEK